jgi:hypothetical protein
MAPGLSTRKDGARRVVTRAAFDTRVADPYQVQLVVHQRQKQTRPKPGAQSHGSSFSFATPAARATKDPKAAERPNRWLDGLLIRAELDHALRPRYPHCPICWPRATVEVDGRMIVKDGELTP